MATETLDEGAAGAGSLTLDEFTLVFNDGRSFILARELFFKIPIYSGLDESHFSDLESRRVRVLDSSAGFEILYNYLVRPVFNYHSITRENYVDVRHMADYFGLEEVTEYIDSQEWELKDPEVLREETVIRVLIQHQRVPLFTSAEDFSQFQVDPEKYVLEHSRVDSDCRPIIFFVVNHHLLDPKWLNLFLAHEEVEPNLLCRNHLNAATLLVHCQYRRYSTVKMNELLVRLDAAGVSLVKRNSSGRTILMFYMERQIPLRHVPEIIWTQDINITSSSYQQTALHIAMENEQITYIDRLLELGARVDICDYLERTPLMLNSDRAMERLLNAPAELLRPGLEIPDRDGQTPVLKWHRMFHRFFELGVDLRVQDLKGTTVLMSQIQHRHSGHVRTLLHHVPELLHHVDSKGRHSLLHLFVKCDEYSTKALIGDSALRLAQMLLEAGADPNHQDQDGNTALHVAMNLGYDMGLRATSEPDLVQLLIEHTDLTLMNHDRKRPVDLVYSRRIRKQMLSRMGYGWFVSSFC